MKNWLNEYQPKLKDYPWIILSAKYGFMEPEHPIGNYDVNFSKLESGPVSEDSLRNQVRYQNRRLNNELRRLRST